MRLICNEILNDDAYLKSPLVVLSKGATQIHIPLVSGDLPYEICEEFRESGHTDYIIFALRGGLDSYLSVVTKVEGGFTSEHIALIQSCIQPFNLLIQLGSQRLITESLLETYLGKNAAKRVLAGAFRRGGGETIQAIIWFCDLRGFTSLVDQHSTKVVLETLDTYFQCAAAPVRSHGGEILKFIGDAVLAIWPVKPGCTEAYISALSAAKEAFSNLDAIRGERAQRGQPEVSFGIALHVGEVTYGNIGTEGRLDFTVIGRSVNEVSRVEGLCKVLSPLLITSQFKEGCGDLELVDLGEHSLRGVSHPVKLFTFKG